MLADERARYGLAPVKFKFTKEDKAKWTKQEKAMYRQAYDLGGEKRAFAVMKNYFAQKEKGTGAEREAAVLTSATGVRGPKKEQAPALPVDTGPVEIPLPKVEDLPAGTLLCAGTTDWDDIGKKTLGAGEMNCLWSYHRTLPSIKFRLIATSGCSNHSVAVCEQGNTWTWGRNDAGQLGLGHAKSVQGPTLVTSLEGKQVRSAATGRRHTLVVTGSGEALSCGSNKCGQLGQGGRDSGALFAEFKPVLKFGGAKPVLQVACGAEHSVALNNCGVVAAWGHPLYGQLGDGDNGEYIVHTGKVEYNFVTAPKVVQFPGDARVKGIACGNNHTVAVMRSGMVYTWGFGGYGRLGHAEQKDEMRPRALKNIGNRPGTGMKKATCGASCTYLLSENGGVLFFGRTKSTGEATMYPKPINDLQGWLVKDVACGNTSTIVLADESVVTWGGSPVYGELGYGDPAIPGTPKSSTVAKLVDSLNKGHVFTVAMGYAHGLALANAKGGEEATKVIDALEEWTPEAEDATGKREAEDAADGATSKKRKK